MMNFVESAAPQIDEGNIDNLAPSSRIGCEVEVCEKATWDFEDAWGLEANYGVNSSNKSDQLK